MENQGKEEKMQNNEPQIKEKKVKIGTILKKIYKVIEKIVMVAIVFISVTIVTQYVTQDKQTFLGFRIYGVSTGSMIPVYNIGDVILVKQKDINQIEVGEDVSYQGRAGSMKGKLVTHRVVGIEVVDGERVFHTRGVANNADDPVISGEQINGVVLTKLHILTIISTLLRNKYVFYFGGILPVTIIIFFSFLRRNTKKLD